MILLGEDYVGSGLDGIELREGGVRSEVGNIGGM